MKRFLFFMPLWGMLAFAAPPQPAAKPKPATQTKPAAPAAAQQRRYAPRYARRWTPPPRPVGQIQPNADRYKEIQQALVERGYLSGEPTGEWKQDSADALKRFQQDQKLEATGKLDSLSLIALGLGPKRTPAAQAAAPGAPGSQPSPASATAAAAENPQVPRQ